MFKRTKQLGRWFFVSIPSKALGLHTIQKNNQFIKSVFKLSKAPICPYCASAKMQLETQEKGIRRTIKDTENKMAEEVTVDLYIWTCLNPDCRAKELLPRDKPSAKNWAQEMRNSYIREKIYELTDNEYKQYYNYHVYYSRIYYIAALLCFIYLFYCIINSNASLLRIIPTYMAVIMAFFVNGMRRSYRSWQLKNKIIYKENTFKLWLIRGKWFV